MKFDVVNFEACERACAEVESELGEVGILVNNAGITRDGMLHKMSPENWRDVISTNLDSCFNMCRVNSTTGGWISCSVKPAPIGAGGTVTFLMS